MFDHDRRQDTSGVATVPLTSLTLPPGGRRRFDAVEEKGDRQIQGVSDLKKAARTNPVGSPFVFLDLLEGDTEHVGEVGLGQVVCFACPRRRLPIWASISPALRGLTIVVPLPQPVVHNSAANQGRTIRHGGRHPAQPDRAILATGMRPAFLFTPPAGARCFRCLLGVGDVSTKPLAGRAGPVRLFQSVGKKRRDGILCRPQRRLDASK